MLDVSDLSRSYDDFVAVDKVSFSIKKGEIVGLLGHNRCRKNHHYENAQRISGTQPGADFSG